jgi:hypothetical protein
VAAVTAAVPAAAVEPDRGRAADPARTIVLASAALVVAATAWTAFQLGRMRFYQGDFTLLRADTGRPLGWHSPGVLLLARLSSALQPHSWVAAAAVVVLLQLGYGVCAARLLHALFGARPVLLAPLALALLGPIAASGSDWWSAALLGLPFATAVAGALRAQLDHDRLGGRARALAVLGWCLLALAFSARGVLLPPLLLVFSAGWSGDGAGSRSWWTGLKSAARRDRPGWTALLLCAGGYLAGLLLATPSFRVNGGASPLHAVQDAGRTLLHLTLPGLAGGPWYWTAPAGGGLPQPSTGRLDLAAGLLAGAVVVAASLRYRRLSLRAWLLLLGWIACTGAVLADSAVTALGIALCLALAWLRPQGWAHRMLRPFPLGPRGQGLLAGTLAALAAAAVLNNQALLPGSQLTAYQAAVQGSARVASPLAPVLDRDVPAAVAADSSLADTYSYLFAPGALTAPGGSVAGGSYLDDTGAAHPLTTLDGWWSGPGPKAGWGWCTSALPAGSSTLTVPLTEGTGGQLTANLVPRPAQSGVTMPDGSVARDTPWIVKADYIVGGPVTLPAAFGAATANISFLRGLHSAYFLADTSGSSLTIGGITRGTNLCVTSVAVGEPAVLGGK